MIEVAPELAVPLVAYTRREIGFTEFHDILTLRLQIISDRSTEEGIELLLEIFACIHEVEDGVMAEETFRQILNGFLDKNPIPAAPVAEVAD